MEQEKELKCKRCGYIWISKVEEPKVCPKCKTYEWKEQEALTEAIREPNTTNWYDTCFDINGARLFCNSYKNGNRDKLIAGFTEPKMLERYPMFINISKEIDNLYSYLKKKYDL